MYPGVARGTVTLVGVDFIDTLARMHAGIWGTLIDLCIQEMKYHLQWLCEWIIGIELNEENEDTIDKKATESKVERTELTLY